MSELVADKPKSSLVDRLRESRRNREKFDALEGENCCLKWARDSESSEEFQQQIVRLRKAKESLDRYGSDCIADLVASSIVGTNCVADYEEFWLTFSKHRRCDVSDAFASGFLSKALGLAE